MLAGGTTPLAAYRALARLPSPPAAGLRILFSDERYVPADSPASNYRHARFLLDVLALPPAQLLRVRTELPLEDAARDYESQLRTLLDIGVRITLGLLGLGPDGHTASLFCTADLERARGRFAIPVQRPDGLAAVSVTPDFLAQIGEPVFVVAGSADKADALRRLGAGDPDLIAWRAVQGCSQVALWICDEA